MRSVRSDSTASHSQTDHNRKTLEDPLTALKQKEIEKKKLLLQRTHLKFPDGVCSSDIFSHTLTRFSFFLIIFHIAGSYKCY